LSHGDYKKAARAFNKAIALSPKYYTMAADNLKKIPLDDAVK
jgi:hypothetical protein